MPQIAGEPIEAMNDNSIRATGANQSEQTLKRRPVERGAGVAFVIEPVLDRHPSGTGLRVNERTACLELDLAG
jgi:hypothetical protein